MPDVETQKVVGGGRICFRGDDRDPSEMFASGFFSRQKNSAIKYNRPSPAPVFIHKEHEGHYRRAGFDITSGKTLANAGTDPLEDYKHALRQGPSPIGQPIAVVPRTPDINQPTAVCVTPRFTMAVLFPPKEKPSDVKRFTWIYAVYVRKLFNTHAQQVVDGLKAIENELAVREKISRDIGKGPYGGDALFKTYVEEVALWTLYAQELSTKTIAASDIICAVKVDRTWKGADFTYGCDYAFVKKSLRKNKLCTLDKPIIKAVKAFFKAEPKQGTTPDRSSGFHKDDENTRSSIHLAKFIASLGTAISQHSPQSVMEESDDADWSI
jgi:hypothetical protein